VTSYKRHIQTCGCGVLWFMVISMCYPLLLLVAAFAHSASPITYEPFHYTNSFNFKWEFGNFDAEHVRTRRNADWRPAKIQLEYVDETWCSKNKEMLVKYSSAPVKCGKEYKLSTMFDSRPRVPISVENPNRYHTLIMLDPDAPSRKNPKFRNWLHWLVINIRNGDLKNGTEVVNYRPPTPPAGSGKHRYIFLLFQQEGKQKKVDTIRERAKFNVNEYAASNDLARVVGFTYFTTEARQKRIKRLSDMNEL